MDYVYPRPDGPSSAGLTLTKMPFSQNAHLIKRENWRTVEQRPRDDFFENTFSRRIWYTLAQTLLALSLALLSVSYFRPSSTAIGWEPSKAVYLIFGYNVRSKAWFAFSPSGNLLQFLVAASIFYFMLLYFVAIHGYFFFLGPLYTLLPSRAPYYLQMFTFRHNVHVTDPTIMDGKYPARSGQGSVHQKGVGRCNKTEKSSWQL